MTLPFCDEHLSASECLYSLLLELVTKICTSYWGSHYHIYISCTLLVLIDNFMNPQLICKIQKAVSPDLSVKFSIQRGSRLPVGLAVWSWLLYIEGKRITVYIEFLDFAKN